MTTKNQLGVATNDSKSYHDTSSTSALIVGFHRTKAFASLQSALVVSLNTVIQQ